MKADGDAGAVGQDPWVAGPVAGASIERYENPDIAAELAKGGWEGFGNVGQSTRFGIRSCFRSTEKDAQILLDHALTRQLLKYHKHWKWRQLKSTSLTMEISDREVFSFAFLGRHRGILYNLEGSDLPSSCSSLVFRYFSRRASYGPE